MKSATPDKPVVLADKEELRWANNALSAARHGFAMTLHTDEGPDVRFLPGGREVRLLGPMTFVDSRGVKWTAPEGAIVDGASIPPIVAVIVMLFLIVALGETDTFFSPFVGLYRNATVLHDYYCDEPIRPSSQVHWMFYEKMRVDGVGLFQARAMWLLVRLFGPRF